jgi:hypothetical protein
MYLSVATNVSLQVPRTWWGSNYAAQGSINDLFLHDQGDYWSRLETTTNALIMGCIITIDARNGLPFQQHIRWYQSKRFLVGA